MCVRACVGLGKDAGVGRGGIKPSLLGVPVHYLAWPGEGLRVRNLSKGTLRLQGYPQHLFPLDLLSVPWPCAQGISLAAVSLVAALSETH